MCDLSPCMLYTFWGYTLQYITLFLWCLWLHREGVKLHSKVQIADSKQVGLWVCDMNYKPESWYMFQLMASFRLLAVAWGVEELTVLFSAMHEIQSVKLTFAPDSFWIML